MVKVMILLDARVFRLGGYILFIWLYVSFVGYTDLYYFSLFACLGVNGVSNLRLSQKNQVS